jgi:hypothetical protein
MVRLGNRVKMQISPNLIQREKNDQEFIGQNPEVV